MCESTEWMTSQIKQWACHGLFFLSVAASPLSANTEEVARLVASSGREGQEAELNRAKKLLAPLLESENPSERALMLHATILQRDHHFDKALVALKQVLQRNPKCAEAWLIQSTIHTVMGSYEEARKSALPLFALAPGLVSMTAATASSSLSGSLEQSYVLLREAYDEKKSTSVETQVWALGSLAEMAVRLGNNDEADGYFERAHQLDSRNPWLTRAFANHLFETERPEYVLKLLKKREEYFPLHWLLAARAVNGETKEWHEKLARYRSVQRSAGHGHAHGREAARFQLEVMKNSHAAFHAIEHEIDVQREPDDLLVALKCARAAGKKKFAKKLSDWVREQNLEDVRLAKWLSPHQK